MGLPGFSGKRVPRSDKIGVGRRGRAYVELVFGVNPVWRLLAFQGRIYIMVCVHHEPNVRLIGWCCAP